MPAGDGRKGDFLHIPCDVRPGAKNPGALHTRGGMPLGDAIGAIQIDRANLQC
jgi:hypothetical protein